MPPSGFLKYQKQADEIGCRPGPTAVCQPAFAKWGKMIVEQGINAE
jgi:hypothetical protein